MPGRHHHRHRQRRSSWHRQHHSSPTAAVAPVSHGPTHLWLKSVDAGLLIAVLAVPFAFGGRHAIGESLLVLGSFWAALSLACWLLTCDDARWVRTRVGILLLAIPAVALVQIVSLPQSVLSSISPALADLLRPRDETGSPSFSEASGRILL